MNGKPAPPRPKRFFKTAAAGAKDGAFVLLLDGRPAKTPARRDLALPTREAADALAAEWNGLGDAIEPGRMPLTRIVNAAIDGVAGNAAAVLDEVVGYAGSDLLFYRAAEPEALVAEQAEAWDPVLDWCRADYGVRFVLGEGVMPVAQPSATLSILRQTFAEAIGEGSGAPFRLSALDVMTTLTGSALLAFAVLRGRLTPEEAWAAAHVDEAFQERHWGQDAEALERRDDRWLEMRTAAGLARLV
ncbi:MAG TPA: ATP12 family protein [Lichenihabitans sp.]|jgi:chaperone required for assembly of F1-ATPase|nr:ATP12 family protein [Lichenihabitans sp.]